MILCNYVMLNKMIDEQELLEYIGEDNYMEFWDIYEMNNQNDLS